MRYNNLGKSDLKISEISFGCMSLTEERQSSIALLQKAFDAGINYFDTADLYLKGENETMVGEAFRDNRQEVIIGTKVGNQWRNDGNGWEWNPKKSYILKAVEDSLRRLQTDYIDLYQLHGGTINDPIDDVIEAFEKLKQSGKIRYYGISSIRPNVIKEYVKRSEITSVMMQYSLLDRRPEEGMLDLLKQNEIGMIARGSLAKGLLAGKDPTNYLDYTSEEVLSAAKAIKDISGDKRTPAQSALQFVLNHPVVTSAAVGMRTEEQFEEILAAKATEPLTEKELTTLWNAVEKHHYAQHR